MGILSDRLLTVDNRFPIGANISQSAIVVAQKTLLVGVLAAFVFIDFDAKARSVAECHVSVFEQKIFVADVFAPWHITHHRFHDEDAIQSGSQMADHLGLKR